MLAFHNNVDKINKISFFVFCMIVIQIIRDIVSGKLGGGLLDNVTKSQWGGRGAKGSPN
jgi:hypothetical protein